MKVSSKYSVEGPRRASLISKLVATTAVGVALSAGLTSAAQEDTETGARNLETVIVTAKKREQSIYEAPVAVTAMSNEDLESRSVIDLVDVGKFVPNLNVTTFSGGNTSSANPFIRGIGIQDHLIVTDPGVGVYVDGVYLGRQVGQNWSLSNIERVEVLRGPQGTLYGRNSIGGAINIITQEPGGADSARMGVTAGSRGRINADFYGNTNLSDTVAVSGNFSIKRRDGIGDFINIENPEARVGELNDVSARVALKWTPTERFSLLLAADGNEGKNGQNPYTTTVRESTDDCVTDVPLLYCLGGITDADQAADPYDSASGQADLAQTTNSAYGFSATAELELTDNLAAKVIGSYRSSDYEGGLDDDGAYEDFYSYPETGYADQYSLEAQLSGEYEAFDFITGVYYFTEEGENFTSPQTFISPGGYSLFTQETVSYAVYANAGYQLTENLRVAGGLRYTTDEKDAAADLGYIPEFDGSEEWSELTWEANATYNLRDDLSVYGAISRGYQSGGFPARPFGGPETFVPFEPVTATNYETGIKGVPVDWLQMALTAFYTEYQDLPVQVSTLGSTGFITVTENAGESRSVGAEWESTVFLGKGFRFNSAIGYIDAEFTEVTGDSPSLTVGDTPALTPEWTVAVGPEYVFGLKSGAEIVSRADLSYRSEMEGQPNNSESTAIEDRTLINFDITYKSADESWSFGLYGKNVTDERYTNAALDVGDYVLHILSNDASEFGVRFTKSFGE